MWKIQIPSLLSVIYTVFLRKNSVIPESKCMCLILLVLWQVHSKTVFWIHAWALRIVLIQWFLMHACALQFRHCLCTVIGQTCLSEKLGFIPSFMVACFLSVFSLPDLPFRKTFIPSFPLSCFSLCFYIAWLNILWLHS